MSRHPDTAANSQPNERLIRLRARLRSPFHAGRSMSRSEMADAVNAALDQLYPNREKIDSFYVTDRWIGKLERGDHHWPSAERRAALRRVTQAAADHDIGLYKPRQPERSVSAEVLRRIAGADRRVRDRRGESNTANSQTGTHNPPIPGRPDLMGSAQVLLSSTASRFVAAEAGRPAMSYVPFRPAALDGPARRWLRGETSPPPIGSHDQPIDSADVAAAVRRLQELRDVDHGVGAGAASAEVASFLRGPVRTLVSGRFDDEAVRAQSYRVAVGARELAGYQAVDLGADGVAQRHYLHALSLTGAANDRSCGAYLLGVSLGHLALHCGFPAQGLRMAQLALSGLPKDATPVLHAALWAVVARCHARLGDESGCTAALRTSETHLSYRGSYTVPEWISYLSPAYLADEVAHCMFDLDHHQSAQREIRQAVGGLGTARVRRLAIDTALLASSLAATGHVDEACRRGVEAVDLAARTTSARAVQRVAQVRADLIAYEDTPCVRDFDSYMRTVLPAAW